MLQTTFLRLKPFTLSTIVVVAALAYGFWQIQSVQAGRNLSLDSCENANEDCYVRALANATYYRGVDDAFVQVKDAFIDDAFVQSQCHQLGHIIGRTAYEKFRELEQVFPLGDSFCWSGYYHGAIEQAVGALGKEGLIDGANGLCASFANDKYSFNHFNCVHGLGHGFMAVEGYELPQALDDCTTIIGSWEQESCYGGVFMENVMLEARQNGNSKYLDPDDLLYPCNSIDFTFKQQCYLMQTSYMLANNGHDFAGAFKLCGQADPSYVTTCYQSMGRDASGSTESDVAQTIERCNYAPNDDARYNCMVGAVKDFVSYHSDTTEAQKLCIAFEEPLTSPCLSTMETYYENF